MRSKTLRKEIQMENTNEIQKPEEVSNEVVIDKKAAVKAGLAKLGIQIGLSVAAGLISHVIVKAIVGSSESSEDDTEEDHEQN